MLTYILEIWTLVFIQLIFLTISHGLSLTEQFNASRSLFFKGFLPIFVILALIYFLIYSSHQCQ